MAINYAKHRRQIEKLYEDECTISRSFETKNAITKLSEKVFSHLFVNQKCKLSQIQLAKDGQTEAQNDIRYDAKLFINPEVEIQQGDIIDVKRAATGRIERYYAGEPFPPYFSHQEIRLSVKEWA